MDCSTAWDGTLCDNYDLHIAQLDTDILPREYDENVQKIVAYDYTIREAEAFQIDLTLFSFSSRNKEFGIPALMPIAQSTVATCLAVSIPVWHIE